MSRVPKVRDIMHRDFAVVSLETSTRNVAKVLLKKNITVAAVVDENERFHGFVSAQGLMLALVDFLNEELPAGPIEHYLDPTPPELAEDSPLMAAVELFVKDGRPSLALPVLRGERLVGVVTRMDVVRAALGYFVGNKDTTPGTLYISALKTMDEKPSFESHPEHTNRRSDES